MNILLVSSFLPYPLYSGGNIRLYNLIKRLSQRHTITLVCEMRIYQTQKDVEAVKAFCESVITVPRKKQWSVQNILKTGFSKNPFLLVGHTSTKMQSVLEQQLQTKQFNLIHCETFYVAQNLPKTHVPVVLVEHNIEYSIYQRFVDKAKLPLRSLLALDVKKLRKAEEYFWKTASHVVAVSDQEKNVIQKYNDAVSVVPNGVDLKQFKMKSPSGRKKNIKRKLLFIGDFSYLQNVDAAKFIIQEVAPLLRTTMQNVEWQIWIKGRKIPQSIKNLSDSPDIIYDEDSKASTVDIFTQADLLLAPIRMGAGTQYKVLEAMAVGTPVITTMLGNEGINAKVDKEICIAETARETADEIKRVLENTDLYETIAKYARLLIEKNFDWEMISKKLEKVYEEVVKKI